MNYNDKHQGFHKEDNGCVHFYLLKKRIAKVNGDIPVQAPCQLRNENNFCL